MRVPQHTNMIDPSSRTGMIARLGTYWGSRRGLLILGGIALTLGVGLNWGWLAAAGVTPILIGLLPCAAMCALGLCMPRLMRPAANAQAAPHDTSNATFASSPKPLQLEGSGVLSNQLSAAPLPTVERGEQSCCAPTERENDYVKENS